MKPAVPQVCRVARSVPGCACRESEGRASELPQRERVPVNFADIAVVVQGPVVGTARDPDSQHTRRCIEAVRARLPGAEVILSTWKGSEVGDLAADVIIGSDDPNVATPGLSPRRNINRQIVSTRNGLLRATRPYAPKLRSDIVLEGRDWFSHFRRYEHRRDGWKVKRERVLASTVFSRNPKLRLKPQLVFHPSDFIYFGLTQDVLNLFDIPLFDGSAGTGYTPEQYIWLSCVRKHAPVQLDGVFDRRPTAIALSELTIANNLVLLAPREWRYTWMKRPNGRPYLGNVYTPLEWQWLYRRYCAPSHRPRRDIDHLMFRTLGGASSPGAARLFAERDKSARSGRHVSAPGWRRQTYQGPFSFQSWIGRDAACTSAAAR